MRRRAVLLGTIGLAACAGAGAARGSDAPPAAVHGRLGGAAVVVTFAPDGTIARVAPDPAPPSDEGWLVPGVIDAHVHLAFWPVATEAARNGLAGAVDLAAPERDLDVLRAAPLRVIVSGPMLTRPGGYPLDAWGSDGYGVGCDDAAAVRSAVDELAAHGARVIKLALGDDGLDPALVPVAVAAAHAHHLIVAAHALGDRDARLAADGGVDVLAHTPIEPLADATVAAWRGRAVISTLAAFGASDAAIDNLRRLRAAGVTVLYGTDLGNERDAGPSAPELELLGKVGLDGGAIVEAMTAAPARTFGLRALGAIAPGADGSLLVVDEDPAKEAGAIAHPREVWLRGRRVGP